MTRHGKAVARLVPVDVDAIIAEIKRLRAGNWLGNVRWQDLCDAGRR
jgi:antitoxin (DNA-binding transcriptional repressor) of toxin-antitoxin stability system